MVIVTTLLFGKIGWETNVYTILKMFNKALLVKEKDPAHQSG